MSRLILVRHGESSGNRERIFALSPHDLPLTELGYRQAQWAARHIAARFRPELVVTSAYRRASETARIIAGALGLPLEFEADLHEREIGAHRGRSYESFLTEPDYDPRRPWAWKPRGGESYEEVQARVGPVLDRLAAAHPAKDVVVVSHGGVMTCLWAYVRGQWDEAHVPPNCGMVLIEHGPQGYSLPRIVAGEISAEDAGG
ncbi:MAG TPA: histidine phosphatase family protein [Steroidobacteraceae bacterium]|jgi:probable phosphoglycerate mutase|nr:histidine phosphatase family protein [Steroidobacteraceae bacterium]